jgi:hypothetical protein
MKNRGPVIMAGIESTSRHVFYAPAVHALPVTPACDRGKIILTLVLIIILIS